MRVTCTELPGGKVYRIYRSGKDFVPEIECLVPFLLSSHANVSIGGPGDDPDVVILFEPLDKDTELAFEASVAQYVK